MTSEESAVIKAGCEWSDARNLAPGAVPNLGDPGYARLIRVGAALQLAVDALRRSRAAIAKVDANE